MSGGPSTTTDANGAYQLAGLAPGTVTITVTHAGYDTVTVSASLGAGVVTSFSPSLYAPGQGPTSATLVGRVVDRATGAAIAVATVKVGTTTATTSATGDFTLASLTTGTVTIEISAAGYTTASFSATLALGTNSAGTIAIDKAPTAITVSGRVTDAANAGAGIGGATLRITGTTLSATTDASGNYAISGIAQTQFTMAVSAAGYQSKNVSVTLTTLANATVDVALDRTVSTGINITQVTPDKAAYDPYTLIELAVGLQNTTAQATLIGLNTTILDPLGNAIMDIAGNATWIAANATATIAVDTHVANQPAGNYSVVVHAFEPISGTLLAEGTASFAINAVTKLGGGITLDPPIAQAEGTRSCHSWNPDRDTASIRHIRLTGQIERCRATKAYFTWIPSRSTPRLFLRSPDRS